MDTGYCNETDIELVEIGTHSLEEQKFLYNIILYRWRNKERVNIPSRTPKNIPTFEEHVNYLQKNTYKKIYKVLLKQEAVGVVYYDNNFVFSIFVMPGWLKKVLKRYKFLSNKKLGVAITDAFMKKNSDVDVFYAGVNVKNTTSIKGAEAFNFEPIEIVYRYKNIYSNNNSNNQQ